MLRAPSALDMEQGLHSILRRTMREDNKPMRKLHDSLRSHFDATVALGEHRPPTGRIEAIEALNAGPGPSTMRRCSSDNKLDKSGSRLDEIGAQSGPAVRALVHASIVSSMLACLERQLETLVRSGRGYCDLPRMLNRLRFMLVNPLSTEDGLQRFLALGATPPYPVLRAA